MTSKGFAAKTSVSVDKTRLEIEKLLTRSGASQRGTAVDDAKNMAVVHFVIRGARYRIMLPLPVLRLQANEQAFRTRWRVLLLLLKAKLEAVRLGVSSHEREFLADMVLDDGRTVHESMPDLLSGGGARLLTQGGGP